jgi:hypothetical protein
MQVEQTRKQMGYKNNWHRKRDNELAPQHVWANPMPQKPRVAIIGGGGQQFMAYIEEALPVRSGELSCITSTSSQAGLLWMVLHVMYLRLCWWEAHLEAKLPSWHDGHWFATRCHTTGLPTTLTPVVATCPVVVCRAVRSGMCPGACTAEHPCHRV